MAGVFQPARFSIDDLVSDDFEHLR
jgi:hypothetical protein